MAFDSKDIIVEFEDNNFPVKDDDVTVQLLSLCTTFGVAPRDLVSKYELFHLNRAFSDWTVTSQRVEGFRSYLTDVMSRNMRKQLQGKPGAKGGLMDDSNGFLGSSDAAIQAALWEGRESVGGKSSMLTPATTKRQKREGVAEALAKSATPVPVMPSPGTPSPVGQPRSSLSATPVSHTPGAFKTRVVRGAIQQIINGHLPRAGEAVDEEGAPLVSEGCDLEVLGGPGPDGWQRVRYMSDRLQDKAAVWEDRILAFGDELARRLGLESFPPVNVAIQEPVTVVGRIVSDGEGRLNDKSVLLEGSMKHCGGARVKLELRDVLQYSVFPGQIVGVTGCNPSGHCLVAQKVYCSLPPPPPTRPPRSLSGHAAAAAESKEGGDGQATSANGATANGDGAVANGSAASGPASDQAAGIKACPLSFVVASGPFTTTEDLSFEPLEDVLSYATEHKPDVLILLGPFVDRTHPLVRQGGVDARFEDIFAHEVHDRVQEYLTKQALAGARCHAILVPSPLDAHHAPLFPAAPFDVDEEDVEGGKEGAKVTCVSNPCTIRCGELVLALSTVDVLKHLSAEEISRGHSSDRLSRLASHLVGQRCFYPLFPPTLGTAVDTSLLASAGCLPVTPDIVILPSDLAPFGKFVTCASATAEEQPSKESPSQSTTPALAESGSSLVDAKQVLFINPGRTIKVTAAGTFAHVSVSLPHAAGARGAKPASGVDIEKCTRIELVKV
eukprot:jgi/Mesvir1/11757/Mv00127-RA.1